MLISFLIILNILCVIANLIIYSLTGNGMTLFVVGLNIIAALYLAVIDNFAF